MSLGQLKTIIKEKKEKNLIRRAHIIQKEQKRGRRQKNMAKFKMIAKLQNHPLLFDTNSASNGRQYFRRSSFTATASKFT